jgi:hypothetical protein
MRAFWKSKARIVQETSARTSSDDSTSTRVAPTPDGRVHDVEKTQELDDSKVPFLTVRTVVMAVCPTHFQIFAASTAAIGFPQTFVLTLVQILAAMGGFIFGYDTGQISGFLQMNVFQEMFGQKQSDGKYGFSDVRSGLIVALVSDLRINYTNQG